MMAQNINASMPRAIPDFNPKSIKTTSANNIIYFKVAFRYFINKVKARISMFDHFISNNRTQIYQIKEQ